MRTIFIRTWFGPLPPWASQWREHTLTLEKYGFDFWLIDDYDYFSEKCFETLGIRIAPYSQIAGTRKAGDFDPCYGAIFQEELKQYDFWGHTGLDCVYGRLDRFMSESFLSDCDVFGNDPGAICGPFSLYRNVPHVNNLFCELEGWQQQLESPTMTAFDEADFSRLVARKGQEGAIRFKSGFYQSHDKQRGHVPKPQLRIEDDGTLRDLVTGKETMMFHFNRKVNNGPFGGRVWPVSS